MILILGGTHEGRELADECHSRGILYKLTVATPLGLELYGVHDNDVLMTSFTTETLESFVSEWKIQLILDASHPHALVIKDIAREVAKKKAIEYVRYERRFSEDHQGYPSVEDLINGLKASVMAGERILVTGVKHIEAFYQHFSKDQIVFRVMPSVSSIKSCTEAGVPLENIIAVKSPCLPEFSRAIFEAYEIKHFVFKNSGSSSAFEFNKASLEYTTVKGYILEPNIIKQQNAFNEKEALLDYIGLKI